MVALSGPPLYEFGEDGKAPPPVGDDSPPPPPINPFVFVTAAVEAVVVLCKTLSAGYTNPDGIKPS